MDDVSIDEINGCDAVVHLAAHSANFPYDKLDTCLYWNALAPTRLFAKAIEAGVSRIIAAGSCFEYGLSAARYTVIPTSAPLEPTNNYATSKAAASVAFHGLAATAGAKIEILRISQVYGNGELESRFWPSLRRAAFAGQDFDMTYGEQVRDFISVEHVAESFVSVLSDDDPVPGIAKIRHVASGRAETLRQFAVRWWTTWNAKGTINFGAKAYRPDEVFRIVPEYPSQMVDTGR